MTEFAVSKHIFLDIFVSNIRWSYTVKNLNFEGESVKIWKSIKYKPGVDLVQERGAPLPGNDKENWRNQHIDVTNVMGYEDEFILKPCSWGRNHFIHPW